MSRPKGSKNKKTLMNEAQVTEKIKVQSAMKEKLESQQQKILEAIEVQKASLKANRNELRKVDRSLASLQDRKARLEAEAEEQAKQVAIGDIVSQLLASGKSPDEIITMISE